MYHLLLLVFNNNLILQWRCRSYSLTGTWTFPIAFSHNYSIVPIMFIQGLSGNYMNKTLTSITCKLDVHEQRADGGLFCIGY